MPRVAVPFPLKLRESFWNIAAVIAWSAVALGIVIKILHAPHRATLFGTYEIGGRNWLLGQYLYSDWKGFVYSPLAAVFFSPFTLCPDGPANIVWRALTIGTLLAGVYALLEAKIFPAIERKLYGLVFLLLLPLALGNFDNGQANPLVIGLLLLAVAAFRLERWTIAALCVTFATYLKIYPVALGLLFILVAPRKFTWRLLLCLLVFGLVPYLFQHWAYVNSQYHAWVVTRLHDNRLKYPIRYAPLDLWFLLGRVGLLKIPAIAYKILQLLGGAAIALYCLLRVLRPWPRSRLLAEILCLLCAWMMLLGPATESDTYIVLAPVVILALLQAFRQPQSTFLRAFAACAYLLLLLAILRNAFIPHNKALWILTLQPLAAISFTIYNVAETLSPPRPEESPRARTSIDGP